MRNLHPTLHPPRLPPARPTPPPPQNLLPPRIPLPLNPLIRPLAGLKAPLHAHRLCLIPGKERGVDLHAVDAPARDAEFYNHPVVGCGIVPPGFPAVVPGAGGEEDVGAGDGRGGG